MRPLFLKLILIPLPVLGALGCSAADETPAALTSRQQLIVETATCSVAVSKVSYDDPGVDDAEFIELYVSYSSAPEDGAGGANALANGDSGPCGEGDADTSGSGTRDPAPNRQTLAACGLGALVLLNGANDTCSAYREFELADVTVSEDGYVVLCSDESAHASACTVTTAGKSRLRNGWLQNGPTDGLRFVAPGGQVLREFAYEGVNAACFQTIPTLLIDEGGEFDNGTDDVNVACGSGFVLQPLSHAQLKTANLCQLVDSAATVTPEATDSPLIPSMAADNATQPAPSGQSSHNTAPPAGSTIAEIATGLDGGLPGFDAGAESRLRQTRPTTPSCSVRVESGQRDTRSAPAALVLALLLASYRRTQRLHAT